MLNELGYDEKNYPLDLSHWNKVVNKIHKTTEKIIIGVVGKYTDLKDSYKSLNEALIHGGLYNNVFVRVKDIDGYEYAGELTEVMEDEE